MMKTNELAPTDMEACLQSRIEDLEQEVRMQRLKALAAAIQAAADMIKPMVTTGSVSITIRTSELAERCNDTVSAVFQGMALEFLDAGGEVGPWYGEPKQRNITITTPSGQTFTAIQGENEVTGAE